MCLCVLNCNGIKSKKEDVLYNERMGCKNEQLARKREEQSSTLGNDLGRPVGDKTVGHLRSCNLVGHGLDILERGG
jgi:hypothetical protein